MRCHRSFLNLIVLAGVNPSRSLTPDPLTVILNAMTPRRALALSLILIAMLAGPVWACSVPVFRYALERWNASSYERIVAPERLVAEDEWLVHPTASDDSRQ